MGSGSDPTLIKSNSAAPAPAPGAAAEVTAIGIALTLTVVLTAADLYWGTTFNGSPAFPSLLLACWWARSRKGLWSLAALLVVVTIACGAIEQGDLRSLVHWGLSIIAILGTAIVCHHLLGATEQLRHFAAELESRGSSLNAANADLAAREHDIATQNEELRSQTE